MTRPDPTLPAAFDLRGRTALVTGGGGLLGREHAAALLELGATVVLADVRREAAEAAAERLALAHGDRVRALELDVTRPRSVTDACARAGDVDVLVNNAAVNPQVREDGGVDGSRLESFSLEEWDRQLAVGLTGAFLCSQAFGQRMAARRRGVILNIASDLSVIAPDQRLYRREGLRDDEQPVKPVTYSVVKTGLIGLTRYLAAYWADAGVRVNALSPGGVQVDQPEEFVRRLSALVPLGRMARRDEYRGAVQFLCSDASSYLTGQNVVIDGGRSVL